MEQTAKGNVDAFGILFERHQEALVAFLTRFLGEKALAEDIAQEAFWKIWRNRAVFDPRQSFRVYLYVAAKNLALNERASARHRRTISLDALPAANSPAAPALNNPVNAALRRHLQCAVQRALLKLPDDQRLCILLREYDAYSYKEIARIMGCSEVAARVLGFRARNRLKRLLAPLLQGDTEDKSKENLPL